MTQLLFSLGLFLSALLLFVIQPMVAKILLPTYGGTPAVWTVCMLFFQALLLVSYSYSWGLSRLKGVWTWRIVHSSVIVLSLVYWPLHLISSTTPGSPDAAILIDLLTQLGLPLLIIASSAPLLQFAYSRSSAKQAGDPYFLYVVSNVGSLLALISYPVLIERFIGLAQQFYYWNVLFIVYLVLLAILLFVFPYHQPSKPDLEKKNITLLMRLTWVFYSFIPCSLMLAVTFYISTDIAAAPVFWVIPFALYLVTYIITFAQKPLISHQWVISNSLFFLVFPILGLIVGAQGLPVVQLIIFHLGCFFGIALLCHGQLVKLRPPVHQLTDFYVCLALGGVLAGVFNGLIAPHWFNNTYEYPMLLVLATLCIPFKHVISAKMGVLGYFNWVPVVVFTLLLGHYYVADLPVLVWLQRFKALEIVALVLIVVWPATRINVGVSMAMLLLFIVAPSFQSNTILAQQRNFYGVKQVVQQQNTHALISQSTMHGYQVLNHDQMTAASATLAYYGPMAAVTQLLQQQHTRPLQASIIGLGTGLMACQFRAFDQVDMIDVDEQVIAIATNPRLFTYLRDCPPDVLLVPGDGRLVVQTKPLASLDLLVVDAFLSDAIPTHLVTFEAIKMYQERLRADGVLAVNASNRHIDLLPVLATAGQQLDLIVMDKKDTGLLQKGQFSSEWVILTANQPLAMKLMAQGWHFVTNKPHTLWTDDYSNVMPLLKVFHS